MYSIAKSLTFHQKDSISNVDISMNMHTFTARKRSCRKVMFLHLSVDTPSP